MMDAFAPGDALDRGSSPSNEIGSTSACINPVRGSYGPASAPSELLDFLRSQSVREAAETLGLARGTVHRLLNGYWPADNRKIVQAWSAYRGRTAVVGSSWFLRRVRTGGVVCHAGQEHTAPKLAARTGQLLAVARSRDGGLVAQTLDLHPERMPLVPVSLMASAGTSTTSTSATV